MVITFYKKYLFKLVLPHQKEIIYLIMKSVGSIKLHLFTIKMFINYFVSIEMNVFIYTHVYIDMEWIFISVKLFWLLEWFVKSVNLFWLLKYKYESIWLALYLSVIVFDITQTLTFSSCWWDILIYSDTIYIMERFVSVVHFINRDEHKLIQTIWDNTNILCHAFSSVNNRF